MARDADRRGSAGNSGILSRIDPFCWIPVVPMVLLALVVMFAMGIWELSLILLVGAAVILGFDFWVNSRRKPAAPPQRRPRRDDFDDLDDRPRREPARRPARQAPPERPAAARGGAPRGGATRVGNPPRGGRPQQRPGGRPGARR
ncbi:hypothetical protein SAMN02982929_00594 [Saccharopolyspora kobensis]|uniref:Uncharacterized protein n=1 Tax=Saccharopolyspora kobensis TaxID=146035 RepID=A0A1H5UQS6_9PSEU|nr:hypothetical protein [Saccharopolyspora kobensis]SEF76788.1 hypothetical protein SAMN02982929_00594 [Saccharopolyspora kobensis]SFC71282.1 hypothetical protein SAMN05216506_1011476 [Saccharopolyspora kobensis]